MNLVINLKFEQDDDGCESSDVMDSEIAKRDVAIALAEEEERCLAREIQETEKAEMPDVDTDGDQVNVSLIYLQKKVIMQEFFIIRLALVRMVTLIEGAPPLPVDM